MSMQWSDLVTAVGAIFEIPIVTASSSTPSSDTNFNNIFPRAVEQAEQRIYRELDLITTQTSQTAALTTNSRNIAIPGGILILHELNVVTPTGAQADTGTRNPVQRVSLAFLNAVCPAAAATLALPSIPKYYALLDDVDVRVGPAPDAAYVAEFIGIIRPAPMTSSNPTTWLGTNLPDLFLAGVNVFMAGYQRDFGAQSDNPQMAVSWEAAFQELKKSATIEEARRKAQSVAWQPYSPAPLATPPRS
ncbi:MAG TPA: hypothetical protein VMF12_19375 [Xanthobacteraceae bacterium]|nr:hypothetical protein [Xanthobacteraceae bacterium]HUC64576.1 hypothetical protein [Stellaceae bacterium]